MLKTKGNSGFTLIELMIAVVIIAIGAAVGFFSINQMMPDLRLSAASRDLKSDLNLAKIRAIRENQPITILFDTDGNSYTIFFDLDGSGSKDAGETMVKSVTMPKKVDLTAAAFGADDDPVTSFDGRGLAIGNDGIATMTNTRKTHDVSLAQTGRVTITKH